MSILKDKRIELGISQTGLARRIKVSRQTIWNWEHGINHPSLEMVETLSNILDLDIELVVIDLINNKEAVE